MHWFPFLCWIKFCSGCLRQVFFIWGTKKVVTGCVRQVVVLYSIDFMDIGPGGLSWFDCMFCPFRLQDSLKCTVISVKKNHIDFLFAENIKVSYKFVLLLLVGMTRHAQSAQCNKFAICF